MVDRAPCIPDADQVQFSGLFACLELFKARSGTPLMGLIEYILGLGEDRTGRVNEIGKLVDYGVWSSTRNGG